MGAERVQPPDRRLHRKRMRASLHDGEMRFACAEFELRQHLGTGRLHSARAALNTRAALLASAALLQTPLE